MGKDLVLVGGGHAHLTTLAHLHDLVQGGHRVTVIGPSEHHYYSGMGPGMLGQLYTPEQIRFATRRVVEKQGGVFVRARVTQIDPRKQTVMTDTGREYPYDVLSFNAGSFVPAAMVAVAGRNLYAVKPIEKLVEARDNLIAMSLRQHVQVAVIGGGASAVEVAGNIRRLLDHHGRHGFQVHLFAQNKVLDRFPPKVRRVALEALQRRRIHVHEGDRVTDIETQRIGFHARAPFNADFIFLATGVRPLSIFAASGLPTGPDGGLAVNPFLQCTDYPNIFGGGDCIDFLQQRLDKVGVYAVRQNGILFDNLKAALQGGALKPFSPGGAYLLILNLGDGTGLLYKWGVVLAGRTAFLIKDRIDRRFMHRFQAIESRGIDTSSAC
jgi:NADH dehydrogenase FAD-containing subunit